LKEQFGPEPQLYGKQPLFSVMVNRPLVTRRAFVAEIDQVFRGWKRNLLFTIAFWLHTASNFTGTTATN
jgi:hypothetical protein